MGSIEDSGAPVFWTFAHAFPTTGGQLGGITYVADDRRPAGGPMVGHLGRRLEPSELRGSGVTEELESSEARAVDVVRAWTVDTLVDARIRATTLDDLVAGVADALAENLCPYRWEPDPHLLLVVDKYGFMHAHSPAPPDETTGQPMELELYATRITPSLPASEHEWWVVSRQGRLPEGPFEFRVETATYSNMSLLGALMPFYS